MEELLASMRRIKAVTSACLGDSYTDLTRDATRGLSIDEIVSRSLLRSSQILEWNEDVKNKYSRALKEMYHELIQSEKYKQVPANSRIAHSGSRSQKRRERIPRHVSEMLNRTFQLNPRPNGQELRSLSSTTGLEKRKIARWVCVMT